MPLRVSQAQRRAVPSAWLVFLRPSAADPRRYFVFSTAVNKRPKAISV